jgi:hypothetical protein
MNDRVQHSYETDYPGSIERPQALGRTKHFPAPLVFRSSEPIA